MTPSRQTDQELDLTQTHPQACVAFVADSRASDGSCLACGHLADEHHDLFDFLETGEVVAA